MEGPEVNRPDRARRRWRGKSDTVDAENAARAVLSQEATAIAKTGNGAVEMIRMIKVARDSAIKARTQAINQLRAVLVRADPALRDTLVGLGPITLVRTCADLPEAEHLTIDDAAHTALRMLARRILALTEESRAHERAGRDHYRTCAEAAPAARVGPDTAAALLITAGDNPNRHGSEAAFAALCGVNPIEAIRRGSAKDVLTARPPRNNAHIGFLRSLRTGLGLKSNSSWSHRLSAMDRNAATI
ncbi:transposase [Nonomuraea purpurea]|uniref:Transposase n=1 Tax=Nonomuraea purpurea TaxID=1849276 RepID=A0ABV8G2J6_9ACTN